MGSQFFLFSHIRFKVTKLLLTIFIIFLFIAFVMIILGEFVDVSLSIIGTTLLFFLGSVLIAQNLQYVSGESVTYSYSYLNSTTGVINNITQNSTNNLITFSESYLGLSYGRVFGFILAVAGVFGFIASLLKIKESRKESEEEGQIEIS